MEQRDAFNGTWTRVFHSGTPEHARLVASILEVVGIDTALSEWGDDPGAPAEPQVLVHQRQAPRARRLLAAYGLPE